MKVISDRVRADKIPVFDILKRKNSKEQKKLSSEQRLINLEKRFYVKNSFDPEKLKKYKGILILDDIFTTGSTVNECTKTIQLYSGIINIHILTIALD